MLKALLIIIVRLSLVRRVYAVQEMVNEEMSSDATANGNAKL